MNVINITKIDTLSFLVAPSILDVEWVEDGSRLVTCEAEITTNGITFRVHAIGSCEYAGDSIGAVNSVAGWLDMRAKEDRKKIRLLMLDQLPAYTDTNVRLYALKRDIDDTYRPKRK